MKKYILSLMTDQRRDPIAQILKGVLWLCSIIYGVIAAITRGLYAWRILPTFKASKPVISVGNVTVGGSGKTPLIIYLAGQLRSNGIKPIILIRGYMAHANELSDEAGMIREVLGKVPVMVGSNRVANIQHAMKEKPFDVICCDDAFQHWSLKRDLDILVIDASNPFGNGHLLPRGILREPLSALKRASIFMLTKTDHAVDLPGLYRRLGAFNQKALVVESCHKPCALVNCVDASKLSLDLIKGKRVGGVCAIGDPSSFETTLKQLDAHVGKMFTFLDHHAYSEADMLTICAWARDNKISFCVTTHKDAVKMQAFKHLFTDLQLVYVAIELELTKGKDEFQKQIMACARS